MSIDKIGMDGEVRAMNNYSIVIQHCADPHDRLQWAIAGALHITAVYSSLAAIQAAHLIYFRPEMTRDGRQG